MGWWGGASRYVQCAGSADAVEDACDDTVAVQDGDWAIVVDAFAVMTWEATRE